MAGLTAANVATNNNLSTNPKESKKIVSFAFVYDVILDETHERAEGSKDIGAILYRKDLEVSPTNAELNKAYPIDDFIKSIPVKNERIELYQADNGAYYYRRINPKNNKNNNALENALSNYYAPKTEETNKPDDYEKSKNNPRVNNINKKDEDTFGKYFSTNEVHRLKLYEGDNLIESRFGQSIRFSAYNNAKNIYAPNLIIRNNETPINFKNISISGSVSEDVNRDGSVIAMTSGDIKSEFIPGTLDDSNNSDFETKINENSAFKEYPKELKGDQILINSGRIILSAKNAEMIFYSKKNYGFISDGALSIDNKLGINAIVGDNIIVKTNDRDINLNTGNGKINLGDKDLEPMVKGQKLVDILSELIDAINQQIYLTPAGPSATGPTNLPTFNSIKSKLNTILSNLNKTA